MEIRFGQEHLHDSITSLQKEWLDTNGKGGYAASTILGCHTRKYHGQLVCVLPELDAKFVLLSSLDLEVQCKDQTYHLACHRFPNLGLTTGVGFLQSFENNILPKFTYYLSEIDCQIEHSLMMVQGENAVLNIFRVVKSRNPITVKLRPMVAYRENHQLAQENEAIGGRMDEYAQSRFGEKIYRSHIYRGMPDLFFVSQSPCSLSGVPEWYYNFEYLEEKRRGFDCQEDLYALRTLERQMVAGDVWHLWVGTSLPIISLVEVEQQEVLGRRKQFEKYRQCLTGLDLLKKEGQKFLVDNILGGKSIIAGFPWFNEWGRDAMIALPGLTLYSENIRDGIEVLRNFSHFERDGIIPNYLPLGKHGRPSYNSVDASMWFFWALSEFYQQVGDKEQFKLMFKNSMENILSAYLHRRVPFAHVAENGLIWAGNENTQLTWMDATVFGRPVTPRHGFAIEINALWYHGLCFYLELFSQENNPLVAKVAAAKELFAQHFLSVFWHPKYNFLADCVNEHGPDFSLRPNQIVAVALDHQLLDQNKCQAVVAAVTEHLATPFGLRTLSPADPKYRARYEGDGPARDGSYHQGTVWPWPVGFYVQAYLRAFGATQQNKNFLLVKFKNLFEDHLMEYGVGSIAEVFDGNAPQRPNGCFAQAWSVAEVIRALAMLDQV